MMEVFEAIRSRASVRNLRAVDVPEADLEQILDAGRRAPSGRNRQPLEFIVVRDPATIGELSGAQACIGDVSVVVLVVGAPEQSTYWLEDVSAATENMLLAITALGYATVWIEGTLQREEPRWRELLGIPPELRLMVALPIGAPVGNVTQAAKRPLSEMVHYERYGRH
ncbi:MAG: nitroreductase family protein [Armatimonadota bacterium]